MIDQSVASTFAELAAVVNARPGTETVQQAIVDTARQLVPGCDHASLVVAKRGRFETVAATDDVARHVDDLERETREGPCLDAILDRAYQLTPDIALPENPWPELRRRVLDETPVRGMAGYRLLVDDRKVGALNLFSDTVGAFDQAAGDAGVLLAAFATAALTGASDHERAETLTRGLESNREIGVAVGLLMAAHGITSDQAFGVMRRLSSELNVKISELARRVVEDGASSLR